jgi:hypothetical protein
MFLIALLINLVPSASAAYCTYHLNDVGVYVGNQYLYFGEELGMKLLDQGYDLVADVDEADYEIEVTLETYQKGQFEHAKSVISVKDREEKLVTSKSADTYCFTQLCGSKDGYKVIRKTIKQVVGALPKCLPDQKSI